MRELFLAELARFRGWALAALVVHAAVLGLLSRQLDLAQQSITFYTLVGAVYALAGLLLGLYQIGSYRRPSTWLYLLHRPVAPWRIALALAGACAVVLAVAIGVPIALTVAGQALLTARVVDLRHCGLPVAGAMIAMCGYLAGAYLLLASRRHAVLASVVLLVVLVMNRATGPSALAVQALVLIWLAALVAIAFQPDLRAPPRHPLAVVVTALPVQLGAYFAILVLRVGAELGWILLGSHPLDVPPPGGLIEAQRSDGETLLAPGLAGQERAPGATPRLVVPLLAQAQQLHSLTNYAPTQLVDRARGVRWTFSHDAMRLVGVRLADGHPAGELGATDDGAAFPSLVWPLDELLLGRREVYQYDGARGCVELRAGLPAPEWIAGVERAPAGDELLVLGDRALYWFGPRAQQLRLPLPGPIAALDRADVIAIRGGYVVSLLYSGIDDDKVDPVHHVIRVGLDGIHEVLARRALHSDWPLIWIHDWWPSPVAAAVYEAALGLLATPRPLDAGAPKQHPARLLLLAATLSLLSLALAIWRVRRISLSTHTGWAWIMTCGVIGIPALVSLWLLYPRPIE
jgi:hypothetical protein